MSLCLTSCVVARRHRLIALIGRMVSKSFGIRAVGGFVRFLVLDEDFTHQLLRAGQWDARLQLKVMFEKANGLKLTRHQVHVICTYRIFVHRVDQQSFSEYRSTIFGHFSLLLQSKRSTEW